MTVRALTRSLGAHARVTPIRTPALLYQQRFYAKRSNPRNPGFRPPHPPPTSPARAVDSNAPSPSRTEDLDQEVNDVASKVEDDLYAALQPDPNSTSKSHATPSSSTDVPPSQPLPDLTQGIPSTIDAELAERSEKADPESLNITEDPSAGRSKGELPKTAYISSLERKRRRFAQFAYAFVFLNIAFASLISGRNWDTEEEERKHPEAPSGWGLLLFYNRVKARWKDTLKYYNEPTFPKLLPDPDPAWARPYTLVLSLEDLLVHGEWSREHGWRLAKRPGMDYFLRYLSAYYELVIWTDSPSMIAQPIVAKLDPYRIVMWPLFREATRYEQGKYIKDLSYLNRDEKKIIILDTDASHTASQPENAIVIPPWKGDIANKDLVSHIPFLEYCATMNFDDLRSVLKSFSGKPIPQEYARREAIMRERQQTELAAELKKRPRRSRAWLSAISGPSPSQLVGPDGKPLPTLSEAMAQGKTYQDVVRERGQKQYEMLEKEIRENGEKWLKEMAEDEKRMNEEAMQGMKKSVFGWLPGSSGGPGEKSKEAPQQQKKT